jgi:hypothetical protein
MNSSGVGPVLSALLTVRCPQDCGAWALHQFFAFGLGLTHRAHFFVGAQPIRLALGEYANQT